MNTFFGYIRVSTARQGEHGVSLQQQKDAIEAFAQRNECKISSWFEEQETAAKRGRPVFSKMLKLLKSGKAAGVIMHKIDRSARNLKDWADLGELIDQGIRVHFANESLDLASRGGRLSADIQAVVAADYIRNLREETKKGFYGRLKQGFYPMPAPIGYLDCGAAKAKIPDPDTARFIRMAFELYASGEYSFATLRKKLTESGFSGRAGRLLSANGLSTILSNPFYTGLIRIRKTGETFSGAHAPIISRTLFSEVQKVLKTRGPKKSQRHTFLFSRMLACRSCGSSLIAEVQKTHVYYRCHKEGCKTTCLRQEQIYDFLQREFMKLRFSSAEEAVLPEVLKSEAAKLDLRHKTLLSALEVSYGQIMDRLSKLTDAYLDGDIEKDIFSQKKMTLLLQRAEIEEQMSRARHLGDAQGQIKRILDLAKEADTAFERGLINEKRELLRELTSNRTVDGKSIEITWKSPFDRIANRSAVPAGSPPSRHCRGILDKLINDLLDLLPKWTTNSTF